MDTLTSLAQISENGKILIGITQSIFLMCPVVAMERH